MKSWSMLIISIIIVPTYGFPFIFYHPNNPKQSTKCVDNDNFKQGTHYVCTGIEKGW